MRMFKVRVEKTHYVGEEALRGFWRYWRDEPFALREALKLFRTVMADNPEVELQIHEGINQLAAENDERVAAEQ